MEQIDAVVVGAGVVGLAVARALALSGRDVLILEETASIGNGTSSRNSEVIHAGIYYPHGSLKARLCVRGRELLYAYCDDHKVAYRRCGKLIVATDPVQRDLLEGIRAGAARNGVHDLEMLDARAIARLEPDLATTGGLLSPSTGIIDSHALMLAMLGDAEDHGAMLAVRAPLRAARMQDGGFAIDVGGDDPMTIRSALLVNAAGLEASRMARAIEGMPPELVPDTRYAKGSYFALSGVRAPFSHLVYPVPERHGLGVHLTLDLAGQARFGPDVEWVDTLDYAVDAGRGEVFYDRIRAYWPALPDGALVPAYAGIRPKITSREGGAADFEIQGPAVHRVPGLVNLFGIESPGLTSSLAIAEEVLAQL